MSRQSKHSGRCWLSISILASCWVAVSVPAFARSTDEIVPSPYNVVFGETYRYAAKPLLAQPEDLFGPAVVGRFSEDAVPDLFLRRGEQGQCFVDPTLFDAALSAPSKVFGIAQLTGTGPGGRDEILATTELGLRAWSRVGGQFTERSIGDDDLWAKVTRLLAVDLDGVNGPDLVGMDETGVKAWVALATPSGYGPELSFLIPEEAFAVVACDFSGDGERQLAFSCPSTLRVYGYDGSTRFVQSAPGSSILTVIHQAAGPAERVAWIVHEGGGDGDLYLFDAMLLAGPFPIDVAGAVGIAGGDLDGDGTDELVVTHTADPSLKILQGLEEPSGPTGTQTVVIGPPGLGSLHEAWPVVEDLDNDGDMDITVPVQADEMIFVLLNGLVDHRAKAPSFDDSVLFNHGSQGTGGPTIGYLKIALLNGADAPPDATHVQLAVWQQPMWGGPTPPSPEPEHIFSFPIASSYETGTLEFEEPDEGVLYWLQRAVRIENDVIVETYPANVYALTTDNISIGGDVLSYLLGLGGQFHSETTPDPTFQGDNGYLGSRTSSTIIELLPIPDFDEEVEPDTGDQQ